MKAQYCSAVLFVKDMAASRHFYEDLLGQQVEVDFGANIGYAGGLALWEVGVAFEMIYHHPPEGTAPLGRDNLEIYFEIDDLDAAQQALEAAGVRVAQSVYEQPWGQRALRVYDPDGHLIEIGEPMPAVVRRLAAGGMDPAAISARTMMPLPFVEQTLAAPAG